MIPQFNPLSSFYPLSLFANGEPGFWLDPSDLSTMYQDSAGTTPVTAVEQPVGLILDKSQGLVLGAELVTTYVASGAFGNWNGMSLAGGVLTTSGAPVNGYSAQVPVTASAMYKVVLPSASVPVGGTWSYVVSWSANGVSYSGQVMTAAIGSLSFYFLAPATATKCEVTIQRTGASSGGATDTCTFNGFSVKKIAGTHYYQSTAGVRPVLSARVNRLIATENFASASWAATFGGTGTGGYTKTPNYNAAPDGTQTACRLQLTIGAGTASIDYCGMYQTLGASYANQSGTWWIKSNTTPATITFVASQKTITTAWQQFTVSQAIQYFQLAIAGNDGSTKTVDISVWHPDCRDTDQATGLIPTYQRVNTSTDYDTAGFPLYLSGNGTQWMQCAAQDYTGVNKMLVVAGVRKLSDAALGVITELSANYGSNNGTFYVGASASSAARYGFGAKATKYAGYEPATFAAPITNVLSCAYDLSTATQASQIQPRINGALNQTNGFVEAGGPTTGAFGNYAAYLFSRAGSASFLTGQIFQIIARGSTVASNAAQIASTEAWTNSKTKAY